MFGSRRRLPALPPTFMFGVATSDHQSEAYDPACPDIWDVWEREHALPRRQQATDFWNRYEEDIRYAQELGCKIFRFSIAWSRVETSAGHFDDEAFAHYRSIVDCIVKAGMEPFVTLLHFTWPEYLEREDGLLADDFPERFARYARKTAEQLGDRVRYWVTLNEPGNLVAGFVRFWWMPPEAAHPPGVPPGMSDEDQMDTVRRLILNLFRANAAGRSAIKEVNPDAMVGVNPEFYGFPGLFARWLDRQAMRPKSAEEFARSMTSQGARAHVDRGTVDLVIATLSATSERAEQVTFSQVYYIANEQILVQETGPLTRVSDLADQVVAVVQGTTAEKDVTRVVPGARARVVRDYPAALAALEKKEVAAILGDDLTLRGQCAGHAGQYRLLDDRLTEERYAVGLPHGNRDLLDAVNRAVWRFKREGGWHDSYERHLAPLMVNATTSEVKTPVPPSRPMADVLDSVSESSLRARSQIQHVAPDALPPIDQVGPGLREIRRRGYLIAGVHAAAPGMGAVDHKIGAYRGFEVDLAYEIVKQIFGDQPDPSTKVRFVPVLERDRIASLRSRRRLGWQMRQKFDSRLTIFWKTIGFLATWFVSDWWYLGIEGKLPKDLCPVELSGQLDFVGLDYYWGVTLSHPGGFLRLLDAVHGNYEGAPIRPTGLAARILDLSRRFPGLPMLICENGCVENNTGTKRSEYLRRHIHEVQRTVQKGANVIGYICWSITSCREWGLKFDPSNDFGLYRVDLDNDPHLNRVPTPAAEAYATIIKQLGAED